MNFAVYSAATGRLRMKLKDATAQSVAPFDGTKLAYIEINQALWNAGDAAIQQAISDATGLVPSDDRHVVVDAKGVIVGVTYADLAIDIAPDGCTFVKSAVADPSWVYDTNAKVLVAPPVKVETQAEKDAVEQAKIAAEVKP